MKVSFLPKEGKFFVLFEQDAQIAVKIAQALRDMVYKIDHPTGRAKEIADIIVQLAVEVEGAIAEINRRVDLKQVLKRCVEINRLENAADKVYRSGLAELFKDSKDMANIIKWREIYEYMETATDRCEDVANAIEGVALKYG